MKSAVAFIPMCVGALLVLVSLFWIQLFPGTSSWTSEKAAQWAEVKDRLHNLSFVVNAPPGSEPPRRHPNREAAQREYDKVKARAKELQAEFKSAYNTPRTTATVLKWSGLSLFILGLVGWLVLKDRDS